MGRFRYRHPARSILRHDGLIQPVKRKQCSNRNPICVPRVHYIGSILQGAAASLSDAFSPIAEARARARGFKDRIRTISGDTAAVASINGTFYGRLYRQFSRARPNDAVGPIGTDTFRGISFLFRPRKQSRQGRSIKARGYSQTLLD